MTSSSFHWRKDGDGGFRESGARADVTAEAAVTYCLHCEWEASAADGSTAHERSKRAVDHHVETGHAIDSILPAASD